MPRDYRRALLGAGLVAPVHVPQSYAPVKVALG
jgi:hypothetical protein